MFGQVKQTNQYRQFKATMVKVSLVFALQILILLGLGYYIFQTTDLFQINGWTPVLLVGPSLLADVLMMNLIWQESAKKAVLQK